MREVVPQQKVSSAIFPDAERVALKRTDGSDAEMIVLAVIDVEGQDYALVTCEDSGSYCYYVFGYGVEGGTPTLTCIDDDERYDEVFHLFDDLIGEDDEDAA